LKFVEEAVGPMPLEKDAYRYMGNISRWKSGIQAVIPREFDPTLRKVTSWLEMDGDAGLAPDRMENGK
jgi:hypothetical protein